MRAFLTAVAWCLLSGWSVSAYAHHSYTAYAVDEPIEISGTVSRVGFVNPHAYFMVDVTEESGAVTSWRVETTAPAVLRRRGWDTSTIQVGDRLSATGAPLVSGDPEMNLDFFVLSDGTRLLRTGIVDASGGAGGGPPGPAAGAAGMGMGMGAGPKTYSALLKLKEQSVGLPAPTTPSAAAAKPTQPPPPSQAFRRSKAGASAMSSP